MSNAKTMLSFLQSHKVSELPTRDEGIVAVLATDDFATAFGRLVDARLSSAPCYDAEKGEFVGFVSLKDLVPLALAVHDKSSAEARKHALGSTDALLKEVWTHLQASDESGVSLAFLARRNPFVSIEAGASLAALARVLVRLRATRVRRVAVVAADKKTVLNVVSQMALIKFITAQLNLTDAAKDKVHFAELEQTVESAKLGSYPCISVDEMTRTYDALKQLDALDKGGLAVTGAPDGAVIGNLSARDLKLFLKNPSASHFEEPVGTFLQKLRAEQVDIAIPVVECKKSATLRHVLLRFSGSKKHRVYVVDEARRPLGVISLGDMLNALFAGAVAEMDASAK